MLRRANANGAAASDVDRVKAVSLVALLKDTCSTLGISLGHRGSLELLPTGRDECVVPADAGALIVLIVTEAVTNAVRFAHPTGVPGRITVSCGPGPKGTLVIQVADDGVGLPEGFDAKSDGSTGLRIMRVLSERLGATLTFNSTSLGLAVSLRLPSGFLESRGISAAAPTSGDNGAPSVEVHRGLAGAERAAGIAGGAWHDDHELLEALPAAVYVTDADGRITFYNEAAAALWGCRPQLGKSEFCGSWKLYRPDGTPLPHDQCPMAESLRQKRPIRGMEAVAERPDGTRVPFIPYPTPLFDVSGALTGAVNMLVDITDRKGAEVALARHRDEQAALYQFTDRLLRAGSLGEVCNAALDAIRLALGCTRASILLYDDLGVMKFVAWRELSANYRRAVEGHSPWTREVQDPQPICLGDIDAADLSESLKATVKAEGIGALAFIPLLADGVLIGKFMTYYAAPHVFAEGEVDLALTIARQLGFSLQRMRAEDARRRAEEELSDFFENAPVGLHWAGPDGVVLRANRRELEMLGYRQDEYVGHAVSEFHVSQDAAAEIRERLADGEIIHNYEAQLRCKDGAILDVLIASSVRWDNGRFVHARTFTRDITDRLHSERAAHRLASIIETSNDAIVSKDLNGVITSWNRGAERTFGYTANEVIGQSVTILIPQDRHDEEPAILARIQRGEHIEHYDTVRQRKDGSLIDISLTVSPIKDAAGKVIGASKIARDITEHKQAQARQELLTREILHRTKNLFAVVQAVVARSFTGKQTAKEAEAAVLSRLHSLAQTHVMLLDKEWQGADLADVVQSEMSPYADRVQVEGPSLMLSAKAAQNFALALHELATNAAKYGALSNLVGRVHISWSAARSNGSGRFTFRWQERGGPAVLPPTQKGFGSVVLEHVMGEYFDTSPRVDFKASGVCYELSGPLDAVTNDETLVSHAGGMAGQA